MTKTATVTQGGWTNETGDADHHPMLTIIISSMVALNPSPFPPFVYNLGQRVVPFFTRLPFIYFATDSTRCHLWSAVVVYLVGLKFTILTQATRWRKPQGFEPLLQNCFF